MGDIESIVAGNPPLQLNAAFQVGKNIWLSLSYHIDWIQNINYGDDVEFGIGYYIQKKYKIGFNIVAERLEKKVTNPKYWEVVLGYRMEENEIPRPDSFLPVF